MKKKIIIILTILFVLLISSVYYFTNKKQPVEEIDIKGQKKPIEVMSKEDRAALNLYHNGIYDVIFRDENNKPVIYEFVGFEEPKEIDLELMTDEEKMAWEIPLNVKIQVLQRDSSGKIMSYHVIKNDSDIVKKY